MGCTETLRFWINQYCSFYGEWYNSHTTSILGLIDFKPVKSTDSKLNLEKSYCIAMDYTKLFTGTVARVRGSCTAGTYGY